MKELLILRHAKSNWNDEQAADHDRTLNDRGKRDAPRMGRLLSEERLIPGLVVTSSAKRARSTTRRVVEALGAECPVEQEETLYLAGVGTLVEIVRALPDEHDRVLLIGHNPGFEHLVTALTGATERMPTAALAQVRLPTDQWAGVEPDGSAELANLWRPKEIGER
ncbi:MAG: hypothetical protein CMJ18_04420 [Phycisphaeraceae bacterium]|nr:hypothetical protein [Phycisphaeraceae bacterium]